MDEKTDIIKQLEIKITQAIIAQNASALNQNLGELTKAYKTFAIFELYIIIKYEIFQHTNADFLAGTDIPREKIITLRWLEATLKNSPYQLSVMLARADIALYNNKLDNACKLFRQSLMLYKNFLIENNLPISGVHSWQWMLKYAVFTEPAVAVAEGEPYKLTPLQLPDSLLNKNPATIITAYGNAPYLQKCAQRLTDNITQLMPDVELLLVVGDIDAETDKIITALQQTYSQLHIAYDIIPENFKHKNLLYTYCACRRFTYLQDIITQSKCDQLITIDIDLYIHPIFKRCVEYVTDAPIGYTSAPQNGFSGDSIFCAPFLKVDDSPISKKYCAQIYDYLTKKFANNHLLWVVDQYALFHAWQNALTHEEQKKCRNINDLDTDESSVNDLYFGSADEQALYTKEAIEKKLADSRFVNIIMPEHVGFDEQTLRPILKPFGSIRFQTGNDIRAEQTYIITQLHDKMTQVIVTQNANGLLQYLAEFTKAHQTFAIYEFYSTIKSNILQHTNGEFLAQQPIAREKMLALRWLESTLKNSPYQLSVMLLRADVALYNNQLDKASKLFRQVLMLYMDLLKNNNLPISSVHAWQWMLKEAVLIEPTQVEGEPYSFMPLQLPDSLINKAPETIITAYGNAPYIRKYAARMVTRVTKIMPEVDILLVVGHEDGDTDAETNAIITALQQKHPQLHIAYDMIPDIFKQKHLQYIYCTCRRFTYLQDILAQSACKQVVTIDIDSFIQPVFKTCVDYTTDAPIGYKCDETVIFFPSNLMIASYFKIDNSDIGRKFSQKLYDYLSKKFSHNHALWFVDQYALLHSWQTALTAEEQQQCRNIYDCNTAEIDIVHLHSGGSQDEQELFAKEQIDKETGDSRLVNIIMPEHVSFDEQTLRPILNRDWDK